MTPDAQGKNSSSTTEGEKKEDIVLMPPLPGCPTEKPYVCHGDPTKREDATERRAKYERCIGMCPRAYCLKVCSKPGKHCTKVCEAKLPKGTDTPCRDDCARVITNNTNWRDADINVIAERYRESAIKHAADAAQLAKVKASTAEKLHLLRNMSATPKLERFDDKRCSTAWLTNHTCPSLNGCVKVAKTCRAASALHDTTMASLSGKDKDVSDAKVARKAKEDKPNPDEIVPQAAPGVKFEMSPWGDVLKFDQDKDSMLSKAEILKAFEEQANAFFDAVDTNKDGQISKEEYETYSKDVLNSDV
jgi:hypothetical protein